MGNLAAQSGLKASVIEKIRDVFNAYPEIEQAILYGSRAKGNYRVGSDIDLTLKGKHLTSSQAVTIKAELDNLMLPYKIDLSLFHNIEDMELVSHIQRVGIVFYGC